MRPFSLHPGMKCEPGSQIFNKAKNLSLTLLLFLVSSQLPEFSKAQCTNFSQFGSAVAPASGIVTITTCQFGGEYAYISGVAAGATYISSSNISTDYFTVRQGTPAGPVVGMGTTPLVWTSTLAGDYYVHLNTNSFCGTDFSCHTVYIERACPVSAPSAVTATPSSICAGSSSNLNATSPGNTIYWYTVPSGGAAVGTSGSGANMSVSPVSTTIYYAAAFNGSCFSVRTPVTVTVNPAPTITSAYSNPDTVCVGVGTNLYAFGCGLVSGFTSTYAPANWAIGHVPITDVGTVNTAGAPASISITSSNGGNFGVHRVYYTITVPCSGLISFNWDYATTDVDGCHYDQPEYAINGVVMGTIPGWVDYGANFQSGSCVIPITAGQTFSLVMSALDDILGAATTVFSGFSAPGGSAGTMSWFTVPVGGSSFGSTPSGVGQPVTPPGPGTVTYYVQTTAAGCTSPRIPVTVVVQSCILPLNWEFFTGKPAGESNLLNWGTSLERDLSRFIVQRGSDGTHFEMIGTVLPNPSAGGAYSFEDKSPLQGLNYYRIEAMDVNGGYSHSNIIEIQRSFESGTVSLFPNPVVGAQAELQFSLPAETRVKIQLCTVEGRELFSLLDQQMEAGIHSVYVPAANLPGGIYLIKAKLGTMERELKMVVNH